MPPHPALVKRVFGPSAIDWTDRSYAIDWLVVLGIWSLSWVAEYLPIYERPFDLNDPLISHPHGNDTVGNTLNLNVAFFVPLLFFVVTGCIRGTLMDIHHGTIALCTSRGLAHLFTTLGKHAIGRLRPDFLARCDWDKILKQCAGMDSVVMSGRKSFPSGHSSTAFSGMVVLSFWMAGVTAAWCFSVSNPPKHLGSSKLGRFFLTLLPLSWATFVAISRVQDYRHHKEDVIVGSLIGIISAAASYLMFWPNPFSPQTFANGSLVSLPRDLYVDPDQDRRLNSATFHLTQLEEEEVGHV